MAEQQKRSSLPRRRESSTLLPPTLAVPPPHGSPAFAEDNTTTDETPPTGSLTRSDSTAGMECASVSPLRQPFERQGGEAEEGHKANHVGDGGHENAAGNRRVNLYPRQA